VAGEQTPANRPCARVPVCPCARVPVCPCCSRGSEGCTYHSTMTTVLSLVQEASEADEVWEERRVLIYRRDRSPLVTVADQGAAGDFRFRVTVVGASQGHSGRAAGNPAATAEGALFAVNWGALD
jgi:hypothetical protein